METDGITIALGATTVGLLIRETYRYIIARNQRTQVANDPLNVRKLDKFVTERQCEQHRCAIGARIQEEHDLLKEIVNTLKRNDERSEARAQATHQRIDPLIKEIGSIRGKVEFFEKAAVNTTIGGRK
jgi:hypothetical protein